MTTKRQKSDAMAFLEELTGAPLTIGSALEAIRLGEEVSETDFAHTLGISRSHLEELRQATA